MIKVQYWNGADGSRNLQMQGHAGAAPKGQDLVCAGASTLALTLGRAAALMEEEEMLARPALVRLEAGDTAISVLPRREWAASTDAIFWTILLGLSRLAQAYPQYVQLKGGEQDE